MKSDKKLDNVCKAIKDLGIEFNRYSYDLSETMKQVTSLKPAQIAEAMKLIGQVELLKEKIIAERKAEKLIDSQKAEIEREIKKIKATYEAVKRFIQILKKAGYEYSEIREAIKPVFSDKVTGIESEIKKAFTLK